MLQVHPAGWGGSVGGGCWGNRHNGNLVTDTMPPPLSGPSGRWFDGQQGGRIDPAVVLPRAGVAYALRRRDLAKVSNATASTMITPMMICWI